MIRLEGLKKSFGSKVILNSVTWHFPAGERIALVGANGAGKTTLLNIICQFEEADGGEVIRPGKLTLGYLPQEPNPNPAPTVLEECLQGVGYLQELKLRLEKATQAMANQYSEQAHAHYDKVEAEFREAGGYALEARAKGVLTGLGFTAKMLRQHPKELSGGWRMRLELARIFLNSPDFLVLDEPTNHLDLPSLIWVEKYLQSFEGTLLFVSHDKDLLNRLSTLVLHLHAGNLTPYKGNFDDFLDQRALKQEQDAAQAEVLRKRKESLVRFIERFGAKATKAAQAQSRMKQLDRLKELEGDLVSEDDADTMSIQLRIPHPSGKEVLRIENGSIGYAEPLSRHIKLTLYRGQKVAIIGANGIGKSTLLKTIVGRIPALTGTFTTGHNVTMGYFAQDQLDTLDGKKSVLLNVLQASHDITERQARALLGSFLFRGDDVFKPVGVLSGGEKSRVGLARMLSESSNFLVLDEPTNHLDMSSAEILASAIEDYEGTVLYVSHDRHFINQTCTHVYAMLPDGRGALFEGKLDDYERLAAVAGFPNVLEVNASTEEITSDETDSGAARQSQQDRQEASQLKKEKTRLERLVSKIEEDMTSLTTRVEQLNSLMVGDESTDYVKAREWQKEHSQASAKLQEMEEQWLETQERLEEVKSQLSSMGRT